MSQEIVAIEDPDFPDWRLGDEVQNVAAGAAAAEDGDPLVHEALGQRADTNAIRGGLDIVEDAVFLLFRLAESTSRRAGLQNRGRARDDIGVARHLVVVVGVAPIRLAGEAVRRLEAVAEIEGAGSV